MMPRSWRRAVLPAGVLVALPVLALGQDRPAERATAKQACIDAAEQGQTLRDDGQVRAARASFLNCASDGCPKVIVQSCTKWLRELDESAPTIVLGAKDEQGKDVTDATVTFDGAPLSTALNGRPVMVDVGEHLVRFERSGKEPVEQKLLLREGEKARVVSVLLRAIGSASNDASAVAAPLQAAPSPVDAPPEALWSARRVVAGALGIGALGCAGVAVAFLVQSNQHESDASRLRGGLAQNGCSGSSSQQCVSLSSAVRSQHDDLNAATGLFIGTGALAAGAVAAWVLWPKAEPPRTVGWVAPLPGGATVNLTGCF